MLCHAVQGDEWEEKWGEHYHDSGKVAKYADKWGKAGAHIDWGEGASLDGTGAFSQVDICLRAASHCSSMAVLLGR